MYKKNYGGASKNENFLTGFSSSYKTIFIVQKKRKKIIYDTKIVAKSYLDPKYLLQFLIDFIICTLSEIDVDFHILDSGTCHGLAFWFDVAFIGSAQQVWLSTAPTEPLTHWYQVRCLLETPLFCKSGQLLSGRVNLIANKR